MAGDPCSDLPPYVTLPTACTTSCLLSALPLYMSRDWGQEAMVSILLTVSWQPCLHTQAYILLHTLLLPRRASYSSEVGCCWPECTHQNGPGLSMGVSTFSVEPPISVFTLRIVVRAGETQSCVGLFYKNSPFQFLFTSSPLVGVQ